MQVNVATINILNDLSLWQQRRGLLHAGLAALEPDFICIQEANLRHDTAGWLAHQLGYNLYTCPRPPTWSSEEGIAILSRAPVYSHHTVELGSQARVAQAVFFSLAGGGFLLANTHLYWRPGDSLERLQQVVRLKDWLLELAGHTPMLVCGDFNATPDTVAVRFMYQMMSSAYAAVHGREPAYTCPTPLPRPWRSYLDSFLRMTAFLRPWHFKLRWRGTLDYIFATHGWKVCDCRLILDQPAQHDPRLYPSDHFGLYAQLEYTRAQ